MWPGKAPLQPPVVEPGPDPDQAWKALSLVNDWIKHLDSKTGVAFATTGATGVLLYNLVKDQHDTSLLLKVVAVACGFFVAAAGLSAATALLPRVTVKRPRLPRLKFHKPGRLPRLRLVREERDMSSLLFFSHVARKYKGDVPTYVQVLQTLTSDPATLTEQIAQQVHANSTVANRKYRWANLSILFLSAALLTLAAVAVIVGSKG